MTAADVIGKYLIAEKDVPIVSFPGSAPIGVVQKGLVVGPVYSWIEKGGKLYWAFDYTIPGQAPGAYYAEHRPEFWKLSTTGAGGAQVTTTIQPSVSVPNWIWIAGAGVLGLFLLRK
jgi:hypothetical protein